MSNILITGCSSGFGRLSALDLARRGERVFATMRNPQTSDLAEVAEREGLPLSVHRLGVGDTSEVQNTVDEIAALAGGIDVLVNNAGYTLHGPLEILSDEEIHRSLDTNVVGVLRMVRVVAPIMRRQGAGRIVNISSLSGLVGAPYEGAYSAAKHAVEAISEALSFELAPAGIKVYVVAPGACETGFIANAVDAAGFGPGHPLHDEHERFWEAAAKLTGGERADPQPVIDAIRRASVEPDPPFRQLVGADVEMAFAMKQDLGLDDPGPVMRQVLELPLPTHTDSLIQKDSAHE